MTEKAVVDRIVDGQQAVLLVGEAQKERIVPLAQLPAGAADGVWLQVRFEGDKLVEAAVDLVESDQTQQRIGEKLAQLRQRPRHFQPAGNPAAATTTVDEVAAARWAAVDVYLTDLFVPPDPVLEAALAASTAAGLPPIQVAPNQGKLLQLLAQLQGARTILEIGTLGGYSTIWLARALPPDGRLITLEVDPQHAEISLANIARAGLAGIVEVRLGPALETLPQLVAEGLGPFDVIFIDADKPSYPDYFRWALRLSHRGSLILADNIVRQGAVIDPESRDANVQGVRAMNEWVAAESRVSATALQTVGSKGYDGFVMALVTTEP
jgi:predicted O-methyltransferase YrrM